MSTLTQILEKLNSLTVWANSIITNAKKIHEFSHQNPLNTDSELATYNPSNDEVEKIKVSQIVENSLDNIPKSDNIASSSTVDVATSLAVKTVNDKVNTNSSEIEALENSKIAIADIVDNLTSTATNRTLSANQGKVLKGLIDNINTLIASDDTTLDEIQEIVNYIKQNKTDLETLGVSNIAGLQAELDGLANSITTINASLENKVDKVVGRDLSENNFTDYYKNKLSGIDAGAEVNVQSDWNATSGDTFIKNKPTSFPPSSHTHTPTEVGLENLPNAKSDSTSLDSSSTLATSKAVKNVKDFAGNYNNLTNKPSSLPPSSHNHDDRYYTESEMSEIIDNSYITRKIKSNLSVGWYTIATNTGDRAVARFGVWGTAGGKHQSIIFYASHHFGTDASNTITVLQNSRFSGSPLKYIRILDGSTYEGAALQIYIDDNYNRVHAAILGDNIQIYGWRLKNWIPHSQDPGDVDYYENFGERAKIDLDLIDQGGIATTGPMYADGDLEQHKVVTYNDKTDSYQLNDTNKITSAKALYDLKNFTTNYNNLTNKPTSLPPSSHTHTPSQVGLSNIPNAKSDSISLNSSTTLATSKAVKNAKDYARNWNNITNKPTTGISVQDKTGREKFNSNNIRFGNNFTFDTANKQIGYSSPLQLYFINPDFEFRETAIPPSTLVELQPMLFLNKISNDLQSVDFRNRTKLIQYTFVISSSFLRVGDQIKFGYRLPSSRLGSRGLYRNLMDFTATENTSTFNVFFDFIFSNFGDDDRIKLDFSLRPTEHVMGISNFSLYTYEISSFELEFRTSANPSYLGVNNETIGRRIMVGTQYAVRWFE